MMGQAQGRFRSVLKQYSEKTGLVTEGVVMGSKGEDVEGLVFCR